MFSTQPEAAQPMPPWPADWVERWPVERPETLFDNDRQAPEHGGGNGVAAAPASRTR